MLIQIINTIDTNKVGGLTKQVRERESESVCVRERENVRERGSVCVRERERVKERERGCEGEEERE